jgi:hypothetical protein
MGMAGHAGTRSRLLLMFTAALCSLLASGTARSLQPQASLIGNAGQWDTETLFAGHIGHLSLKFQSDRVLIRAPEVVDGRAVIFSLGLVGAPEFTRPVGEGLNQGRHNFLVGSSDRWRAGVNSYSQIRYLSPWEGTDVVVSDSGGILDLTYTFAPGTDPMSAVLRIDGSEGVLSDGTLRICSPLGELQQRHLSAWQLGRDGARRPLASSVIALNDTHVAFRVPDRSATAKLVVSLGLEWATFLGGSDEESPTCIGIRPDGAVLVGGNVESLDFPVTPGVLGSSFNGDSDVFLSMLTSDGSALHFSTYLGGSDLDTPGSVSISDDGSITVGGYTRSEDYPTTPGAYDRTLGGIADLFVTRISEDGVALVWSTVIGGNAGISESGQGHGAAVAPDGSVYLVGVTQDFAYPVTAGAFDTTANNPGVKDVVVSHLSADGSTLLHSTFLGGTGSDTARGLALTTDGIIVVGSTTASNYPVTPGAFDPVSPGDFVTKLDLTLSTPIFSTILDANDSASGRVTGVASDPSGNVSVVGYTLSDEWPTTPGAFDTTGGGSTEDAFVTKLNASGSALVYSTYLGGGSRDGGSAIVVDSAGTATITGFTTASAGVPATSGGWDLTGNGGWDGFVAQLSPDGSQLWYGTFAGGSASDSALSIPTLIARDKVGSVVIASVTSSTNFPVTEAAFDPTLGGPNDGYVAKFSMLPTGVARYGNATQGCGGYLAMGITAMPKVGQGFALTCLNAPASSTQGLLAVGLSDLSVPLMAKGTAVWVNPTPLLLLLPWTSNVVGFASLSATLPNDPSLAGASFTVQSFWPDACVPPGQVSASNALAVTIQP